MTARDVLQEAVRAVDVAVWPAKSNVRKLWDAAVALLAEPTGLTVDEKSFVDAFRGKPKTGQVAQEYEKIIDRLSHVQAPALTAEQRATVEEARRLGEGIDAFARLVSVFDAHFPPPEPVIKRGDRVKWYRGEDYGTGRYGEPGVGAHYPHYVLIANDPAPWGVDRVERIEGGEA